MKAISIANLDSMNAHLLSIACVAGIFVGCDEPPKPIEESESPKQIRYTLSIPKSFQTESFSRPYAKWKNSLIENLGYSESQIFTRDFLATNLSLSTDGTPSHHRVYVSKDNPRLFLIPEIPVLISFDGKIVGTMGVEGISQHHTNDQKFAILIHPSGSSRFFGVPVGDLKTESPEPEFQGKESVSFFR